MSASGPELNFARFSELMTQLGCDGRDIRHVNRLVARLSSQYTWIGIEDLFTVALEAVPRAQRTYREEMGTQFTTWLVTVVRNDLVSFIGKEKKVLDRFTSLDVIYESVDSEPRDASPGPDAMIRDEEMELLSQMLSPLAWRILQVSLNSAPRSFMGKKFSRMLGVSLKDVELLKKEIFEAVKCLRMES